MKWQYNCLMGLSHAYLSSAINKSCLLGPCEWRMRKTDYARTTFARNFGRRALTSRILDCSRWYAIANTRLFTIDLHLGTNGTYNVAQYPLRHVIKSAKFEAAYYIEKFRRGCIYKNTLFDPCPWCQGHTKKYLVPTLCDLCTCKV